MVRSAGGELIGHADVVQVAHGSRFVTRLVYHLPHGSVDDERTVSIQGTYFHLLSDHHIQKGPFFKQPIDIQFTANGDVTTRTTDKDGKDKVEHSHLQIPPNVANGLVGAIMLNADPGTPLPPLPYVAATGKGRLVTLDISPERTDSFRIAGVKRKATVYRVKVDLGGVAKVVAPMIGKEPADQYIWVVEGEARTIVREVGPLYLGGPILSIELAGGSFAPASAAKP